MTSFPTNSDRPGTVAPRQCRNCGNHVSVNFSRVFGDNQDRVDRCPSCTNVTDLLDGGAVRH